jgi:hypothetical protein
VYRPTSAVACAQLSRTGALLLCNVWRQALDRPLVTLQESGPVKEHSPKLLLLKQRRLASTLVCGRAWPLRGLPPGAPNCRRLLWQLLGLGSWPVAAVAAAHLLSPLAVSTPTSLAALGGRTAPAPVAPCLLWRQRCSHLGLLDDVEHPHHVQRDVLQAPVSHRQQLDLLGIEERLVTPFAR